MTENIEWVIPPSTCDWLAKTPSERPVVALLRHSVRGYLPPGRAGDTVPITQTGVSLARELGATLGRRLRSLHVSPILRCRQTAEELRRGASLDLAIRDDRLLGDHGIFVLEPRLAGSLWREHGHEWVMERLVTDRAPQPGLAAPDEAARFLVQHMLSIAGSIPGVHVFVTHDSLVTATAARLLDVRLGPEDWPWYLEAAWFWEDDDGFQAAYREQTRTIRREWLVGLDEGDVIEFARREIAPIVGLDCPARFFLAGGAFKTLLTSRPARDLDLWAPIPEDRKLLERQLRVFGAEQLQPRPYTDAYRLADREIELPLKAEPPTLEARLGRFDIALSAVGVEFQPDGPCRAVIHPLAQESVRRREVLLLKPLVNEPHALTTLERARRYAGELGYALPAEEEDEIWKVFEAQLPEGQQRMLENFEQGSKGDWGVREDALCRCR